MALTGSSVTSKQYADADAQQFAGTGVACDRLRQALKQCLKQSDCVQIERRPARQCINASDGSVSDSCIALVTAFSDCKRSIIDQRARFRGRKGDI